MGGENGTAAQMVVLECLAGHTWEFPAGRGGKPETCPEHKKYFETPISARNKPPDRVRASWERASRQLDEKGYVKRWEQRWLRVVKMVAARRNSFGNLPLDTIEEFIRHERLAELHLTFAERDPYTETESGNARAHPGWEKSRLEEVAARRCARELGLISESQGVSREPTRLQESAAEHGALVDDQGSL